MLGGRDGGGGDVSGRGGPRSVGGVGGAPGGEQQADSGTWLAVQLARVVAVMVLLVGLMLLLLMPLLIADQRGGGYCESGDHPGDCESQVGYVAAGLAVTALGTWVLVAARALRRGRRWGPPAMVVTHGLLTTGLVVGGIASAMSADHAAAGDFVPLGLLVAGTATVTVLSARSAPAPAPG